MFEFLKNKSKKSYNEEQFKSLFDGSNDLIIFVGSDGKIVAANQKMSNFFGFRPEDFIRRAINSVTFIPPDSPKNTAFFEALKRGYEFASENLELIDKYHIRVQASCRVNLINVAGQDGILIIISESQKPPTQNLVQSSVNFLTKTSEDLQKILSENDLYQYAADGIVKLISKSWVSVAKLVDEKTIEIVATATSEPEFLKTLRLMMKNPIGKRFTINEKASFFFQKDKFLPLQGGIYALTFGQFPEALCRFTEKAAGITGTYVMAFVSGNKVFGNAAVVTASKEEINNIPIIEAFINQVSVALQKSRAEDTLQKLEVELEKEKGPGSN